MIRSSRGPALLALRPRSRQGTPTAFWEGSEHQRYSKAKKNPSPRRSAYRRFILGHGVAAPPELARPWNTIGASSLPAAQENVTAAISMPSRSTPPCLRKNFRPYTAGVKQETRPERSDIQMASADVTVTMVTGNITCLVGMLRFIPPSPSGGITYLLAMLLQWILK